MQVFGTNGLHREAFVEATSGGSSLRSAAFIRRLRQPSLNCQLWSRCRQQLRFSEQPLGGEPRLNFQMPDPTQVCAVSSSALATSPISRSSRWSSFATCRTSRQSLRLKTLFVSSECRTRSAARILHSKRPQSEGRAHRCGHIPHADRDVGVAAADTRDIAEAAAISLTEDGHDGQTYDIVASSLISGPSNAALWSKLLGKEIQYTGHNFDQWEETMRANKPSWSAYDLRMMFQGYFDRGFASTETQVALLKKVLGRAPRSYEDFAAQTAAT